MEIRCLHCMEIYDDEYEICPHCGFIRGTLPKEVYHLHPGMTLAGRYSIGTVVGYGGFGVVYRAWDSHLDIMVCIKEYFPASMVTRTPGQQRVIPLGKGSKLEEYRRNMDTFIEEARSTAKFVNHPNIINVLNYFEENGTAYMVMEYLDGETLKDFLKHSGGVIDVDTTIEILLSVINALKEVHKQGMLHRDISPDNIFICTYNKVKLIDFGAAKFSDEENEKTREIVLKPGYAPPEQYESKSIQAPWTDIYALGATMYRAITGEVPDESTNRVEEDNVKSPREFNPNIPEYIDSALMRAMSVTPEFRFRNVQEFEDAIVGRKVMRTEKQQRKYLLRRRLMLAGTLLIVIAVGAGIALNNFRQKRLVAKLEECTISVWMPVDENDELTAMQLYDAMVNEFQEEYEQVQIEVEYVNESEYSAKLMDAFATGNAPTVFDGQYLKAETMDNAADLSAIFEWISKGDYYFFSDYETYFPTKKQMPLGFTIPMMFTNFNMLNEGNVLTGKNDLTAFGEQEATFLVAGNDSYYDVQKALPGLYKMSPVLEESYKGHFVWLWSVNGKQDEAQINAGVRLLYYFLGENAQDALFIQHVGGFPINKEMMSVYTNVNPEMEIVGDEIEKIYFDSNELLLPDDNYYDRLYAELFTSDAKINQIEKWILEE